MAQPSFQRHILVSPLGFQVSGMEQDDRGFQAPRMGSRYVFPYFLLTMEWNIPIPLSSHFEDEYEIMINYGSDGWWNLFPFPYFFNAIFPEFQLHVQAFATTKELVMQLCSYSFNQRGMLYKMLGRTGRNWPPGLPLRKKLPGGLAHAPMADLVKHSRNNWVKYWMGG